MHYCYLEDFFVIGAISAACQEVYDCFIELLQDLSFDISRQMVVSPLQVLVFLGVLIDTVGQYLALPNRKLLELRIFLHYSCIGLLVQG